MARNTFGMELGRDCRAEYSNAGIRRWYKNRAARKMRRLAKIDPINAPRRYAFYGWA